MAALACLPPQQVRDVLVRLERYIKEANGRVLYVDMRGQRLKSFQVGTINSSRSPSL